jgi:hypothetical protein
LEWVSVGAVDDFGRQVIAVAGEGDCVVYCGVGSEEEGSSDWKLVAE